MTSGTNKGDKQGQGQTKDSMNDKREMGASPNQVVNIVCLCLEQKRKKVPRRNHQRKRIGNY